MFVPVIFPISQNCVNFDPVIWIHQRKISTREVNDFLLFSSNTLEYVVNQGIVSPSLGTYTAKLNNFGSAPNKVLRLCFLSIKINKNGVEPADNETSARPLLGVDVDQCLQTSSHFLNLETIGHKSQKTFPSRFSPIGPLLLPIFLHHRPLLIAGLQPRYSPAFSSATRRRLWCETTPSRRLQQRTLVRFLPFKPPISPSISPDFSTNTGTSFNSEYVKEETQVDCKIKNLGGTLLKFGVGNLRFDQRREKMADLECEKRIIPKIVNIQSADVKKQTVFFLQTADVWSTSSAAEACRCGPQTADGDTNMEWDKGWCKLNGSWGELGVLFWIVFALIGHATNDYLNISPSAIYYELHAG
ncbi:hypothetical protein LXL04_033794 [Taraxacum kok-saghyz]